MEEPSALRSGERSPRLCCAESSLSLRAEALAEELLAKARHRPGESVRRIVSALGHQLEELPLRAQVRGLAVRAQRRILLVPSGFRRRDEFTIAHELLELHIPSGWIELPEETKERLCDRGAAALLLPARPFLRSLHAIGADPLALQAQWPLVSRKVLRRRIEEIG